jgi:hypothetical protein
MYHPELQPELASRNIDIYPIPLNGKNSNKNQKRKIKNVKESGITLIEDANKTIQNSINSIFTHVAQEILSLNTKSQQIPETSFTNYKKIAPLLKEAQELGVKYFTPNLKEEIENLNKGGEFKKHFENRDYEPYNANKLQKSNYFKESLGELMKFNKMSSYYKIQSLPSGHDKSYNRGERRKVNQFSGQSKLVKKKLSSTFPNENDIKDKKKPAVKTKKLYN